MTEESEGTSSAPGSGAGDAAPTQAIPRIPKPSAAKRPPAAKKAPAKKSPTSQTDKGRPREVTPPASVKPAASTTPLGKDSATEQVSSAPSKPIGGPTGRPLTAADYASTTKQSPSSTAVFPAVKEKAKKVKESVKEAAKPSFTAGPAGAGAGSGRRASLRLTHVEPWSVTRLAFAISVAMMVVAVVAAIIFWAVLDFAGVWRQINDSFTSVLSDDTSSFDVKDYFGFTRVIGLTLVLSAVNVVITTVLATIGAHLYNLAAQLMGGIEVTFAEEN